MELLLNDDKFRNFLLGKYVHILYVMLCLFSELKLIIILQGSLLFVISRKCVWFQVFGLEPHSLKPN